MYKGALEQFKGGQAVLESEEAELRRRLIREHEEVFECIVEAHSTPAIGDSEAHEDRDRVIISSIEKCIQLLLQEGFDPADESVRSIGHQDAHELVALVVGGAYSYNLTERALIGLQNSCSVEVNADGELEIPYDQHLDKFYGLG